MTLHPLLSMDRRSRTIAVILGCLALFACVFTGAWL
jgi:hypothetical protein